MKKKQKDKSNPLWKKKGFSSLEHYKNWLWFNNLTTEESMYDDVYVDVFSGAVVDINQDTDKQQ